MSTKHVVLGLLSIEPMAGYELAQNIKISVDSLWAATHSQIYPALQRLEEEERVSSRSDVRGQSLQRTVYTITRAGEQEFIHWLSLPIQYLPFRDPFNFWASYLDECPPESVFQTIDAQFACTPNGQNILSALQEASLRANIPLCRRE